MDSYVNTEIFNQVLADFATEYGLGSDKRVLLTIDQAGWHTSNDLDLPEGIDLIYLPAYSPELQPAERLWPLTTHLSTQNAQPLPNGRASPRLLGDPPERAGLTKSSRIFRVN